MGTRIGTALVLAGVMSAAVAGVHAAQAAGQHHGEWVTVTHADERQPTAWDCAPTSASMALDAMGVHVDPRTLATEMGSNGDHNTTLPELLTVFNRRQPAGEQLVFQSVSDGELMAANLRADLGRGLAVPEPVTSGKLPWDADLPTTQHVILVDGVTRDGRRVRVYDPDVKRGGTHVLTSTQLFRALQPMYQGVITGMLTEQPSR